MYYTNSSVLKYSCLEIVDFSFNCELKKVLQCLSIVHNSVVVFGFVSSSVFSLSLLDSDNGIDMLFSVLIWGLLCSHLSRASL